jgi:hypothetical protein
MINARSQDGFSPASSEGGTNLNIHERAVVVGESGHIYATLGEKRPDGSIRAEQLMVKPLKSEVEKDKQLAENGKKVIESQKQTMKGFAAGGMITAGQEPSQFINEIRKTLGGLGGAGGGTGAFRPALPDIRLLAGAPANALADDPDLLDYTKAAYSSMGISPNNLMATLKKFQTASPIGNTPRVSFI